MSLAALFEGMTEVRAALTGDRRGHLLEASEAAAETAEQDAATVAMAVAELDLASESLGLGSLQGLQVRSTTRATLTAVGADAFLFVSVDPLRRTAELEKKLAAWESGPGEAVELVTPTEAAPDLPPPGTSVGLPVVTLEDTPAPTPREDPWAALRRSLVRAHLSEAVARLRDVADAPPGAAARPGSEPLPREELGAAMQVLLEGIGYVMAGDTMGGTRALRELASTVQRNASIRWVALYWISRAALNGSGLEAARAQVEEALALSRQLDVEARALSQLVAAELLTRAGKHDKALTWISESRSRFERVGDPWGIGQTWLVEARIQAACGQEEACLAAARRARQADPAWDGPPIFLAGRALTTGDLAGAEALLDGVSTPAADRVRKLIEAVRQQHVRLEDAGEFLRLHHSAPTAPAIRALERIAEASPRFYQAREALAWMLVKLGKYGAARDLFTWLEAQPLEPEDRAGVQLGLSTVASAQAFAGDAPAGPAAAPAVEAPPRLSDSVLLTQVGAGSGGAHDSVFSGRLSVFSLPDLVEFLRSARRTGTLVCSSPSGLGTMHFRKGWITGASSPSTPAAWELLVRSGKVSAEAARQVMPEDARPGLTPCEALVKRGLAEVATVQAALRQQAELTLRELLGWKDGEFAFNQGSADAPPIAMAVQVDAQELLLTLFKEMDEASRGPSGASA
jgi:predicted regulator of Ras-like GTPase activity (Roadblock/LC7/MglB family)/tetratricopeptide (TPR) repeat protein